MKKLHLDIEALHVDSFVTDEASRGRGTVHGRSAQSAIDSCIPGEDSCTCPGPGHCGRETSNGCTE